VTPVDLVGDTGGFLTALHDAVDALTSQLTATSALVEALIVAVCVLIAVEVARGVMKR
jgi:hypothetical protein